MSRNQLPTNQEKDEAIRKLLHESIMYYKAHKVKNVMLRQYQGILNITDLAFDEMVKSYR